MVVRVTTLVSQAGSVGGLAAYPREALARSVEIEQRRDVGGEVSGAAGYYGSDSAVAFWHGPGAERLGLSGVPLVGELEALMLGVEPGSGARMGHRFGERSARGFDATFSVQKEVSILWAAANVETRAKIEEAVVTATVAVLNDAVGDGSTRMRRSASGNFLAGDQSPQVVGAEGPAVAVIPEFTSRLGDPQMHVHAMISSKVWEPTTRRWLALDARELKMGQRALSAKFHAGLEAELARTLGVGFGAREYPYARTINGIDRELVNAFSKRSADVADVYAKKLSRFRQTNGCEPTPQQRWRIEREAVSQSRPKKSGIDHDFEGWQTTIQTVTGMSPSELVSNAVGHEVAPTEVSLTDRANAALNELVDSQSSFTRTDLIAELARVQPLTTQSATEVIDHLNDVADQCLEQLPQVTPAGTDRAAQRWSTPHVINEEINIFGFVDEATKTAVDPNNTVDSYAPDWLDPLQLQAAGRVASNSDFELIVGLAGAGKTSMLKTAADTLEADGRTVFGLAPSAVAAGVLNTETGIETENVAKFLWEHQSRDSGPLPQFQLPAGSTLIIDEAGMVSTPQWAQLTQLSKDNNWKIRAVGDGYQFSAIGRGGVFDMLSNTLPEHRISRLEQVHRFNNPWEAKASKQLRAGNPKAIDTYFNNGRVHPTTPENLVDTVTRQYMKEHCAGTEIAMFAGSNDLVNKLNVSTQQRRLEAGQLGPEISSGFYVGDLVETRSNNRNLTTNRNQFVKNRDRWTITQTSPEGVELTGKTGTVTIPHDYLTEHTNLAYAQTSHGSQGRTINGKALTVIDPDTAPIDRAGLYVPLTRGKQSNEIYIAASTTAEARQQLQDIVSRRWIDTPAISRHHQDLAQLPPLTNQVQAGNQILDKHKPVQQTLFPAQTPNTIAGVEAIRSAAKERQPNQTHSTINPDPGSRVEVGQSAVRQRLLTPRELIDNTLIIRESKDAPKRLVDVADSLAEAKVKHVNMVNARNELVAARTAHIEKRPLIWKRDEWKTSFEEHDRTLARSSNKLEEQVDKIDRLTTALKSLRQTQTPQGRTAYKNALKYIAADQEHHGHLNLDDPTMIARLGHPPSPKDVEACAAWKDAVGAITHNVMYRNHYFEYDPPNNNDPLFSSLRHEFQWDEKRAIKTLAEHVGQEQVPELAPKRRIDRGIERSL